MDEIIANQDFDQTCEGMAETRCRRPRDKKTNITATEATRRDTGKVGTEKTLDGWRLG